MQLCGSVSILWHCLSLGLECKLTFSSPVATAEFSKFAGILSAALSQHHLSGFGIAQLEFHHCHYWEWYTHHEVVYSTHVYINKNNLLQAAKYRAWYAVNMSNSSYYCHFYYYLHHKCTKTQYWLTGKGQFSFQSQRKAMPKNAHTTTQLHSFHMLQGDSQNPSS